MKRNIKNMEKKVQRKMREQKLLNWVIFESNLQIATTTTTAKINKFVISFELFMLKVHS